ncbi:cupredoxin domain-containing protein [Lignipirellula cremea]|nr:hypothetical protein [Lignipirellula cremea]
MSRRISLHLSLSTLYLTALAGAAVLLWSGCPRTLSYNDPLPNAKVAETIRKSIDQAGSGGGAAAGPQPQGWATIRGVITVNGATPSPAPLETKTSDPCGVVLDTSLLVNPENNGLAYVVVFLNDGLMENDLEAAAPKWVHPSYRLTEETRFHNFDQKNCIFLDRAAAVRSDQELRILNSDGFAHNTSIKDRFNRTMPANSEFNWGPNGESRDPVPVSCAIHPWMSSHLLIRDNPYFAVTDANGRFEIKNVPSDVELEFRVWHERTGYVPDATVNGQAESWSKGKFSRTFTDGEELEMNVVLNNSLFQ